MVKAYLRYAADTAFGVVCSGKTIIHPKLHLFFASCLERVVVWDHRKENQLGVFHDPDCHACVTELVISNDYTKLAVGYTDGTIRLWPTDIINDRLSFPVPSPIILHGHRSAVSVLVFNSFDSLLASGSNDTDVVVWDVLAENGLFRFRGHTNKITGVVFYERSNMLISCARDGLIKMWDLSTQHCIQTLTSSTGPFLCMALDPSETLLFAGILGKQSLKGWRLDASDDSDDINHSEHTKECVAHLLGEHHLSFPGFRGGVGSASFLKIPYYLASSKPKRQKSVSSLFLAITAHRGRSIVLFKVCGSAELRSRFKKRSRKVRKHSLKRISFEEGDSVPSFSASRSLSDYLGSSTTIQVPAKLISFAFCSLNPNMRSTLMGVSALTNNTLVLHEFSTETDSPMGLTPMMYEKSGNFLQRPGHRSDVRVCALSYDDGLLVSTSSEELKVWNTRSCLCVHTLDSGYGLTTVFVPGCRHVIVGTKEGTLEIFELESGTMLEKNADAHGGPIWGMDLLAQTGIVTGSADHTVKFWDFKLVADASYSEVVPRLTLEFQKSLSLVDEVLCLRISKDGKFLAVGLLDTTIKVYKLGQQQPVFFLSLYGHKLPVLALDISDDSALLISGGGDKNIKIWGLDYGDCHRSIFAHDNSITGLTFCPKTHYFFSSSKDCLLKYWDADKFEEIQSLKGHCGEIWGIEVSREGDFVVSVSSDRSIRFWRRIDEQLFLDEEREKELESRFEASLDEQEHFLERNDSSYQEDAKVVACRDLASIRSGEELLNALEIANAGQLSTVQDSGVKIPSLHPTVKSPSQFVRHSLIAIPSAHLEQALLMLPCCAVPPLLLYLCDWIADRHDVELCSRCALFLVRVHIKQLSTSRDMLPLLQKLRRICRLRLQEIKDTVGFNCSAILYMQRVLEQVSSQGACSLVRQM